MAESQNLGFTFHGGLRVGGNGKEVEAQNVVMIKMREWSDTRCVQLKTGQLL